MILRIPSDIRDIIDKFIIVNDGSSDNTSEVILSLSGRYKIINADHGMNKGYAQAQKTGFRLALREEADIVVLLHSDGQYAPEELQFLLKPLLEDKADIVQGSRILGGRALKGGMPLYKYLSIRLASVVENFVYGMNLKEFHSGYMLYSAHSLKKINFEKLSDTMYFDGEMLFSGHSHGLRIKSMPISTRYTRDIKSTIRPVKYSLEVSKIIFKKIFGLYKFNSV